MSLNLSEEDFIKMMSKNKSLKINTHFGKNNSEHQKITIIKESPTVKNNNNPVDFDKVVQSIKESKISFTYDESSLLIILDGARVLSVNQIYALLQKRLNNTKKSIPYYIVTYKKIWSEKMNEIVENIILDSIKNNQLLPNFNKYIHNGYKVKLFIYRQSTKLLDEDNIYGSFKVIIDCLRKKYNFLGIEYNFIPDDNKNFISQIEPHQVKNKQNIIAIKMVLDEENKEINNINEFSQL